MQQAKANIQPIRRALRVSDVSRRIGACETIVRQMIADKEIPSYRIGRSIFVDADMLERWIVEQTGEVS